MNQTVQKMTHNGQLLKKHVEQAPALPIRIAERMGITHSTLLSYYNRPALRTSVLWSASKALDYNFFFDLGMQLPNDLESALNTELTKRVAQLEKENEQLRIENAVYERILKRDTSAS
ncbi:MAG: hypothetical protein LBR55_05445 [Bacteroidales bacterium]|nr:hypothetical protein [Bacteroidales bacterium]